jgi:hypothetical protein
MSCPYFQDKCICAAKKPDLYVPPKEVEFRFCRTDGYAGCEVYRRAGGQIERLCNEDSNHSGDKTDVKQVRGEVGSSRI